MKKVFILNMKNNVSGNFVKGKEVILDKVDAFTNKISVLINNADSSLTTEIGQIYSNIQSMPNDCVIADEIVNGSFPKKGIMERVETIKISDKVFNGIVVQIIEAEKDGKVLSQQKTDDEVYTCKIVGAVSKYPGKQVIMSGLLNNQELWVTLVKVGNEILAYYDKAETGTVYKKTVSTYTSYEKIDELFVTAKSINAKVTKMVGTNYTVSFTKDDISLKKNIDVNNVETLDVIKSNIVNQGLYSLEELDKVQNYLQDNDVKQSAIKEIFKSYKKYDSDLMALIPTNPTTLFQDYFGAIKRCVTYINKGKFLRFTGPKGTGKNKLITTLAWIYKRPLWESSLNSQYDKYDLLGTQTVKQTIDDNGNKVTEMGYEKEALIRAMEAGGFLNLDELNTVDPAVLIQTHSVMDERKSIQVSSYGKVTAQPGFCIIGTMNYGYQGTKQLNEATRDRFSTIRFPRRDSIMDLLKHKNPGLDQEIYNYCEQLYQKIVEAVEDGRLPEECITIRGFEDALDCIDDLDLKTCLIDNVVGRVDDEDDIEYIMDMIDLIMDK